MQNILPEAIGYTEVNVALTLLINLGRWGVQKGMKLEFLS